MPSEEVPQGQIVEQDPKAGEMVKAGGQEITVEISAGGTGLIMPDLYNKDQRVAETSLRNMGLTVKVETDYSEQITKGNVMSQTPDKEEPLEEGQEVTIVVSQGRKLQEKAMIPVTNMTLEEATKALEDMGLRVGKVTETPSDTVEAGKVCAQSIPVYTIVKEETQVDLEVSTGTEIMTPPGVSLTPAPTESEVPTASPAASEAPQKVSKRDVTVTLPNDRETVAVRITVGGSVVVDDQLVDTRLRIARFTVEGSGVQEIVIYLDGAAARSYTEDFGG